MLDAASAEQNPGYDGCRAYPLGIVNAMPLFVSNPSLPAPLNGISTTGPGGRALEISGPDFEMEAYLVADIVNASGVRMLAQGPPVGDVLDGTRAWLDQFYLSS